LENKQTTLSAQSHGQGAWGGIQCFVMCKGALASGSSANFAVFIFFSNVLSSLNILELGMDFLLEYFIIYYIPISLCGQIS